MKRDKPFSINTITVAIIIFVIRMTTLAIMVFASTSVRAQQINPTEQQHVEFKVQNTSMSVPAPNAKLNNQSMPHQIVSFTSAKTRWEISGLEQQRLLQANP